ncbi:TraR/DksA C4-type zinc finger protein [Rhizobium rhizogenes]|uniref:Molecular chaperone DnaK n=1 Tax=Rhizobium rhizogenes TaxID=359 RepID=A0AA92HAA4_RHIRH|nr:TraR/DksA C4-type zinc finger protein [Rhizobium rhizogenes]PVE56314.1 molecular chaperone DnaK [Rhizobium rhizogenes]PVE64809.1 molecular chaperone DnaK [Agrobacterium tumefaciens]PVE73947.1 molecular chaperone DnaK [Sphingomonas sp. TPD3009]
MNFGGNAAFDQAEQRAEQEREAKIAEASRALLGPGSIQCEDCPNDIPQQRRQALPSATRCIDCQTRHERRYR